MTATIETLQQELEVAEAFHRVAVAERNAAWQEIERHKATIQQLKGYLAQERAAKERAEAKVTAAMEALKDKKGQA